MNKTCKVPDCDSKVIHLRGLCRSCYVYACTLVFHKMSTWDAMQSAGCIDEPTGQIQSPKRPERTAWFARAAGMAPDAMNKELRRRVAIYEDERAKKKKRS